VGTGTDITWQSLVKESVIARIGLCVTDFEITPLDRTEPRATKRPAPTTSARQVLWFANRHLAPSLDSSAV
jgi:hypothetical protein